MVFQKGGCVYIMANKWRTTLYTGVSSDIINRVWEHKNKVYPKSFTVKYHCDVLVYYKFYPHIEEAIAVEKLIKGGSRAKKELLINSMNPEWVDLYDGLLSD